MKQDCLYTHTLSQFSNSGFHIIYLGTLDWTQELKLSYHLYCHIYKGKRTSSSQSSVRREQMCKRKQFPPKACTRDIFLGLEREEYLPSLSSPKGAIGYSGKWQFYSSFFSFFFFFFFFFHIDNLPLKGWPVQGKHILKQMF